MHEEFEKLNYHRNMKKIMMALMTAYIGKSLG